MIACAGNQTEPRSWSSWTLPSCLLIAAAGLSAALGFDHWLERRLPLQLLRAGPLAVAVWRWLLLPAALSVALSVGYLLSRLTRQILLRITRRTRTTWDEALVASIDGPLTLACMLLPLFALVSWLGLSGKPEAVAQRLCSAGLLLALFFGLVRMVDVIGSGLVGSAWARTRPAAVALLPLLMRVGKVALIALGLVALLSELGYPVASLVAGLGIGGLAIALAAQKTVENLFGAFSLGADQPFREGDFVRIEDFVGTVESIGLRSTRIRTLDRTLITIPNGKLAEMRLESYAARDRMRFACNVGLVYSTTAAQMQEILSGLERVLREHPKVWPDAVVVRFKELGESSLNIEIMAWFQTPDWSEFQLIRQETLLRFMAVVADAGGSFAFPSHTVFVESAEKQKS